MCWAICHDVGQEASGSVTGGMNTFANIGGTLSPLVVGYTVAVVGIMDFSHCGSPIPSAHDFARSPPENVGAVQIWIGPRLRFRMGYFPEF